MKKTAFTVIFSVVWVFCLSTAWAADAPETNNQKAMDILNNMTRFLAGAEQFSVTLQSRYDAPQENGQIIEFGAIRQLQIKRPGRMRVDVQKSDGDRRIMVFDGKRMIIHNITENVYAKAEKEGTVDDAIKYLVGILETPLPLARMFLTTAPAELEPLIEEISYVGLNTLTDGPTHHLAVRARDVDFQVWIAQGKEPLPKRLVITYKNFEGDPQFRCELSEWNLDVNGVKGPFTFTPSQNAELVPMLVRVRSGLDIQAREGDKK